jgi:RNA polymerase sigma-70 factor (ECF subfamily)
MMNPVDTEQFETYRPLMFSIAYRMLGSITDAEDMVQEAYLRFQTAQPAKIESPKAYFSTVVTRLCLNHLQSAQMQRESYIGPWLPEPVLTAQDERFTPDYRAELHESLSLAFLALLEQLTPLERAVFLLREVFDYSYEEIAEITGKQEVACRQVLSRAKKHIAEHRPRFKSSPEAHRQLLNQFVRVIENGDMDGLLQLLSEDVVLWADSGGKVPGAIYRPLLGSSAVARFLFGRSRLNPQSFYPTVGEVNGELALVIWDESEIRLIISIEIDQERICAIRAIGNPDKLKWANQTMNEPGEIAE